MIYYVFSIFVMLLVVFIELPILDYFKDLYKKGLSKHNYYICILATILLFIFFGILLLFIFSGIVFFLNTK